MTLPAPTAEDPGLSQADEATTHENNHQNTETSASSGTGTDDSSDVASFEDLGITTRLGDADPGAGHEKFENLGIITARPKRIDFADSAKRLDSFKDWPPTHHKRPENLAPAGFFYAGYSDCARCFYCGGGLCNWTPTDDVWVEHARWFQKCVFLQLEVGEDFIEAVRILSMAKDEISFDEVMERLRRTPGKRTPLFKPKHKAVEEDPAVLTLIDYGFAKDEVIVLALEMRRKGEPLSLEKLYRAAKVKGLRPQHGEVGRDCVDSGTIPEEDRETIEALRRENGQLRQRATCRICMDMDVAVVFLPCGHFVSCTECSRAVTQCPCCDLVIKGIIRVSSE